MSGYRGEKLFGVQISTKARAPAMDQTFEQWKTQLKNLSWRKITRWSYGDLCRLGIDTMNLLCAAGLPGAERMDIRYCLRKIHEWAERVKCYTAQMKHVYERRPEQFGHSLAYFKALCLITALQRDCGVRYNPAKRDLDSQLEVSDTFIFGIIQGDGGTCASLPVLYCAVGHQLSYPMFLVHTKGDKGGHSFVQWDDGEVRFNIEATGHGMATPTDEHYRVGRFQLTPEIEQKGCFLKPDNMRHCLAGFLAERSKYCMDIKAFQHAVDAMGWAAALHPENHFYLNTAKSFYNEWLRYWTDKKPPRFPEVVITAIEKRRFSSTVPLDFELDICCVETMECLLKDQEHDRKLWEPLRRGQQPHRVPVQVESRVDKNGAKTISFLFDKSRTSDQGEFTNV